MLKKSSKKLCSGIFHRVPLEVESQQFASPSTQTNTELLSNERINEESGDPSRLRSILSSREEFAQQSESSQFQV